MPVERPGLNHVPSPVDTGSMIDLELELVRENPHWLTVLCAYQAAHEESRKSAEKSSVVQDSADESSADDLPADTEMSEADQDSLAASESDESKMPKIRKAIWLSRLIRVEGVDSEELSRTHGRLIAYGLLKCDLADRSAGVVYQLTSTGKQVIARLSSEADGSHDEAA